MATVSEVAGKALDAVRPPKAPKIPAGVQDRLKRGQDRLKQVAARREEAISFAANNHYVSIDKSGTSLNLQDTVSVLQGGYRPDHRVRRSHDLLAPIIKGKVSAATQRIPGYEVLPASSDPEDYSAARTAKNVAAAGYEIWDIKEAFRRLVWNALVTEEGFIMPFWDSSVGPYVDIPSDDPTQPPRKIGMGEVKAAVYGGLEVIWEPGVRFEESPWFAIEHARPKDAVEAEEGFIGDSLTADNASKGLGTNRNKGPNLVIVTEFLERPCPKYPNGRRMIFANGRTIFPEEDYPLRDHEGNVVDAPCLHRLYYTIDADSDRDRGLIGSLVESLRQYDYASNKAAEYLQLVLIPQMTAPEGSIKGEVTDQPGAILEYDPADLLGGDIKWRDMPSMPREFGEERDRAEREIGSIALDTQVPASVESGKAMSTIFQKDALAWQDFIEDLAKVHARFMRDALCLVQLYYTEDRLVKFRGRTGWEAISDFKGADLRGQTDVRVSAGSLEPLTRPAIEQRIMNLAQMFPGHFPPEVIISALSSADPDRLNESYEEDEARVNFIIAQIRSGQFWDLPPRKAFPGEEAPRLDDETGEPAIDEFGNPIMETELPGWMPRPFDGIPVHKMRLETFMKSDEWNHLEEEAQQACMVYYDALLRLEAQNAQRQAALQSAQAEQLGMQNAAKPQGPKPMPSMPSADGSGTAPVGAPA